MTDMMYGEKSIFHVKEFWSAATHFTGFVCAVFGMPLLMIKAVADGCGVDDCIGFAVYMISMILLYGASTCYHALNLSGCGNLILKKMDHISIFLLIAGTYTPVCVSAMNHESGFLLMIFVWMIAAAGVVFKLCWVNCPKWLSSIIYTAMGWVCIFFLPQILSALTPEAVFWLALGGLLYTAGAVIYAFKPSILKNPEFGNHEVFHCFVLAGSLCQFIFVFQYLA